MTDTPESPKDIIEGIERQKYIRWIMAIAGIVLALLTLFG
jgi:hypothetical protein